jgi:lycopene beta-cyclase
MKNIYFHQIDPAVASASALWVLTLVAMPIVGWSIGENALYPLIKLGVALQTAAVITVLVWNAGRRSTLVMALPILLFAWLAEFLGSTTGFPFGRYSYTLAIQPQLGGVPLLIPFAWLMMLPAAWAVASSAIRHCSFPSPWLLRLTRALVSALAFTAWDLLLDPQMVAWNFWAWSKQGLYFGIPLTNFLGWLLVSFILSLAFCPYHLPEKPLLLIYAVTGLLQFIGQFFFWGLPGPALIGFLGMGGMLAWALLVRKHGR